MSTDAPAPQCSSTISSASSKISLRPAFSMRRAAAIRLPNCVESSTIPPLELAVGVHQDVALLAQTLGSLLHVLQEPLDLLRFSSISSCTSPEKKADRPEQDRLDHVRVGEDFRAASDRARRADRVEGPSRTAAVTSPPRGRAPRPSRSTTSQYGCGCTPNDPICPLVTASSIGMTIA